MEIWDLLDESRNPVGKTHTRGTPMQPGCYHLAVEIWTVNSKGEVLLTLRAPEKKKFPNLWENTAGSVLAGESSIEGAVRELGEETGIHLSNSDFHYLGSCMEETAFVDSYLVCSDLEREALTLQPGETVDAQWVSFERLEQMIHSGEVAEPIGLRYAYAKETLMRQLNQRTKKSF